MWLVYTIGNGYPEDPRSELEVWGLFSTEKKAKRLRDLAYTSDKIPRYYETLEQRNPIEEAKKELKEIFGVDSFAIPANVEIREIELKE